MLVLVVVLEFHTNAAESSGAGDLIEAERRFLQASCGMHWRGMHWPSSHLKKPSSPVGTFVAACLMSCHAVLCYLSWIVLCSLDDGLVAGALLKTDGVAHLLPELDIHLISHTLGN